MSGEERERERERERVREDPNHFRTSTAGCSEVWMGVLHRRYHAKLVYECMFTLSGVHQDTLP